MIEVLITALGVGGATVIGALIGFLFKNISHKFSDIVLSFAAGIMLSASIFGLIIPSIEYGINLYGEVLSIIITILGIFAGAIILSVIDKAVPHIHKMLGDDIKEHDATKLNKVLLFVLAIAIHNFPEGIASGVGFGTGDVSGALVIAGGIALQNIPEGMVIISPLLASGVSKSKTLIIAVITGLFEVIGTFIGYFAVQISAVILPFMLAFAGGTMLYVISDEIIPETHSHGVQKGATYALLVGFSVMLVLDVLLG